ncbi:MAG: YgiQ family radical SAM protein, partial [Clostridia bacterium]|nr:YgiQ family radical SAM protein [Clostridia bacterium]
MFLPVSKQEFEGQLDFVLISADAYVDHPSFGHAIISRYIQSLGFSVGIIAQPLKDSDYKRLGEPKHGFLISGGVVDSMVNNYTVAKRKRDKDEYSEGGKVGMRPDRATIVYSKKLKQLFPNVPVIIGGIEASLRRFAHYDYWSNTVMPTILLDSGADLLVYGMGEKPFKDILALVAKGVNLKNIKDVRGTAYLSTFDNLSKRLKADIESGEAIYCPSFEEVKGDKIKYVQAFNIQSKNVDPYNSKILLQKHKDILLVQNKPQYPLSVEEMDAVYSLPYERTYHPMYKEGVPAITEVKYSLTSVRGCFGSCSYCALTYHQGRIVQKRSEQNIIDEATEFTKDKDFKGYIHD